ncbi:MAG: hypothetical protein U0694_18970 [Anaerolineae bacterium]
MKLPRPILIAVALAGLLALALAFDVSPWLRGGFGWRWTYDTIALPRALPLLIATVIYIAIAYRLLTRTQGVMPLLLWAMLAAALLPLCVIWLRSNDALFELFARTASGLPTGQHLTAAQLGWDAPEWRDWMGYVARPELAASHIGVAPPGLPLWYNLLNHFFDTVPALGQPLFRALLPYQCANYNLLDYTPGEWASAWFGVLMPLWSAFSVIPLYAAARRLNKDMARAVSLWFPLIPSLLMFSGTWSTFYPFMMLCVFWALLAGLQPRSNVPSSHSLKSGRGLGGGVLYFLLAGFFMGVALFMNYTFIPLLGVVGLYTLLYYLMVERRQSNPPPFYRPVLVGLWFGIGMAVPWVLYWLYSGDAPWEVIRASLGLHLDLDRPYLPWVFIHYWDWTMFNSFVLMLVGYFGLWRWLRKREGTPPVLTLALFATVIFLALSGTGRGEAGRVWMPFTPFVLLAAAEGLPRLVSGDWKRSWLALTLAHAAVMLVLAIFLNVMSHDFVPTPLAPVPADHLQTADATFAAANGDSFRLEGWNAQVAGDTLTLQLRWSGITQSTQVYFFSALLVAPDGTTYNTGVWQPGGAVVPADSDQDARGTFPTTCWLPGAVIGDSVTLALPADAASGDWWISLAAYGDNAAADGRLMVTLPDGAQDSQAGLGPVQVP